MNLYNLKLHRFYNLFPSFLTYHLTDEQYLQIKKLTNIATPQKLWITEFGDQYTCHIYMHNIVSLMKQQGKW